MNWLSQYYATLECRSKVVIFRILGEEEFKFLDDKSFSPQNLIFFITTNKMLKKGCQGYLVSDTAAEQKSISDVLVAYEFLDVFSDELTSLLPYREIEFYINMVQDTTPISIPPYRMASAELKKLKE